MPGIGHNTGDMRIQVEVRLFNTLAQYGGKTGCRPRQLDLPAGATVEDIVRECNVPLGEIHLVLRNGRDVTPWLKGEINTEAWLDDGDVIALSGPVPYSWAYGAPIV